MKVPYRSSGAILRLLTRLLFDETNNREARFVIYFFESIILILQLKSDYSVCFYCLRGIIGVSGRRRVGVW